MSSPEGGLVRADANPYAAPQTPSAADVEKQPSSLRGRPFALSLALVNAVVQCGVSILAISYHYESFLDFDAVFVHLIATSLLILVSTIVLKRLARRRIAFLGSQLVNFINWSVLVVTIQTLHYAGFASEFLTRRDCWIFFGIFVAGAIVTALVCVFVQGRDFIKARSVSG